MNSSLHFFTIPALGPGGAQAELNQFLQSHRVVAVEKQWAADGAASFWAICVTVLEGPGPLPASVRAPGYANKPNNPKTDYREVLSEADFTVFAELRNLRSAVAQEEGVPTYQVFTNEQLACMVRERVVKSQGFRKRPWLTRGKGIAAKKVGTDIFRAMQRPTARMMSIPNFFVGANVANHAAKTVSSRVAARVWIHAKGSLTMDQTGVRWCGVKQSIMPYPNRKAAGVLVGGQKARRRLPGRPTFGFYQCLKNGYYG